MKGALRFAPRSFLLTRRFSARGACRRELFLILERNHRERAGLRLKRLLIHGPAAAGGKHRNSIGRGSDCEPPILGDTWVMAGRRDRRDFRDALLTVRIYKLKNGAGDRGRTGDVQLGKLAFYH
jgi:hypothetical protein